MGKPRRLALVLVLAGMLRAAPAAAQFKTVDAPTIKGAHDLILIPENWNGSLFIYAHGYSADERLVQPLQPNNLPVLLAATILPTLSGYASATSTFRSVGWDVEDAIKDVENLRRYFVKKYGKPKFTYMWGHSEGGMITQAVIEYAPHTYDGALPLCAVGAGARRNFDGAFDLRVLYDYVCANVSGAGFGCGVCTDGTSRCLADADCPGGGSCTGTEPRVPLEDGLSAECTDFLLAHPDKFSEDPTSPGGSFVSPPVTACFGDVTSGGMATPEQLARRSLFVRASQLPESFIVTDMFFATIGMAEVIHRRTHGRHPWGNEGVDYASPGLTTSERDALNTAVYRADEDAPGVRYMRRFYEPRGRTNSKVLTVHALDDGLVLPENEDKYREAFEAANRSDQLVQLFTTYGGHCGFITELVPSLDALTKWVEQGEKPSTASLRASCSACRFADATPGPWGVKVVERRQRGAPVRTLVCSGEPGDCPPHAMCAVRRHRCRQE
jgi:pimeloyl-ACP methyl ester carboxylesterase